MIYEVLPKLLGALLVDGRASGFNIPSYKPSENASFRTALKFNQNVDICVQ